MRDQRTDRLASGSLPSIPDVVPARVSFQSGATLPQDVPAINAATVSLVTSLSHLASVAFGSCSHRYFFQCPISILFLPTP